MLTGLFPKRLVYTVYALKMYICFRSRLVLFFWRGHDILYIGIASENLYNRFLNQELRAKGHGTFLEVWGLFLGTSPRKDR